MKPLVVLSLGGSVVVPKEIDLDFLRKFSRFVRRNSGRWRFIIAVGGGKTCRVYQEAARKLGVKNRGALDWIGIKSTWLNAELLRALLGNVAEAKVYTGGRVVFRKPVLIAAGDVPGSSTDHDAVSLALRFGVRRICNLTNIPYVYDKDPKKFRSAKPLKFLTWKRYLQIAHSTWRPGVNLPFDTVASRLARKSGLKVIIANGKNLRNLQNILEGKEFTGTIIF
ncbi:MAG: UMP kinase [Candidatus Doudnabacteria bacterium]|nr:UMP kinase [Candidatus Doudnabacteria bacterium]